MNDAEQQRGLTSFELKLLISLHHLRGHHALDLLEKRRERETREHHYQNRKSAGLAIKSSHSALDIHLIFLQASSFGAGRVWAANGSLQAFFDQKLHILLQALRDKDKRKTSLC